MKEYPTLDDYYVTSLKPRLAALLAEGRITPHMHREFELRVKAAEARARGSAPARELSAHPVQRNLTPTPTEPTK